MIRALTPELMKPSARVVNFWASPWAFWMSASKPCAVRAACSIGLSKASQRAELAVSGRMTPTLPLAPPAAAGADDEAELLPAPPLSELFAPHAESTKPVLTVAARRVRVLLRILVPSGSKHCVDSARDCCPGPCGAVIRRSPRRTDAHMLWATTYAAERLRGR